MKVTTESGASYTLVNGICTKVDHEGYDCGAFKVWTMKAIDTQLVDGKSMEEVWEVIYNTPIGEPEVGKRLFLSGRDEWWISTPVVSIEE